ncbi:glycoside hydrolase family protein [Calycomorphotria hydatis]|uniref:Glycosyl hydrolase family 32 N-terminal domain-containing protein n=1 Tax=Calycomorphotria hydatis TaxID=2528027 RepID=A0A517TDB6_9PLAN|nr:glycosyl hydrolase [Calycomorphotria hydatis]QDT66363.1 hypothetical protein V22_36290 [Calycomorphotria hydatis]
MFKESDGSRKTIGDVDILYHDGLYHLFHLVLPNHDFIAHAVSTDGLKWRRVGNALFIGDPGSWDDLMLWTMHVSPDPHQEGRWRMFYTGLSRKEQGDKQRIGLAFSEDLYHWKKAPVNWSDGRGERDPEAIKEARSKSRIHKATFSNAPIETDSCFPLEPDPEYYEASVDEPRGWISCRDPFFVRHNGDGYLLFAGRINRGPLIRRGCVGVFKEVAPLQFEALPELHHPQLYDDVEVPNLVLINDEYYLIGSIREDAKIRYWHAKKIGDRWKSYHDNVLLPQGNYAGRVCKDEKGWLLWGFFSMDQRDRTANNLMPPPKRLTVNKDGLLRATTYERLLNYVDGEVDTRCVNQLSEGLGAEQCSVDGHSLELVGESGFQAFVFDEQMKNLLLKCKLKLDDCGKCGLIFRIDPETHDGYYLSLDLLKGVAQLRSWKTGPPESKEMMMEFVGCQSAYWFTTSPGEAEIQLIAFGSYIELSIDGRIVLSLADQTFDQGLIGFYVETAELTISDIDLRHMSPPDQTDQHLAEG